MKTPSPYREISELLRLGLPISLAHLANMLLQVVDLAFVGRLGPNSLGGLSVGNAVYATIMVGGVGLLLGLDFLISHAFGSGKKEEANRLLIQALYLATLVSLPCIAVMHFPSSWLLNFGIAPEIAGPGTEYLRALSWSLWPWLLFTVIRQYLQSWGTAIPVMVILVLANVVNAVANWVLIFGNLGIPAMGIAGSAWATLIARIFMFLAIAGYLWNLHRRFDLGFSGVSKRISRELILKISRIGLPAGSQVLLEVGAFALVSLLAARFGAIPLSSHQVVLQIASLTFMVPLGLSSAASVRVAQALGAGEPARAARIGWSSLGVSAAFMGFAGVIMFIFPRPLIALFTPNTEVIQFASGLLLLAALFQLFDGVQIVATGVLRGVGNTRSSMVANLFGHWALGLPIGAVLGFGLGWGVFGLWIGLSIGLIFVAITLTLLWRSLFKSLTNGNR